MSLMSSAALHVAHNMKTRPSPQLQARLVEHARFKSASGEIA
jgi:hypothetical protein